ncbi:MAG: DUF3108 domain-containing protein [Candidatus Omnitrophota bacterium]|nr:DUF3108 domain-containing protein [Candidatus Omnitrophota bacterium]
MFKLKTLYLCILLPFLIVALIFLLSIKSKMESTRAIALRDSYGRNTPRSIKGEEKEIIQPDYVGEKIIYDVKLGKLYLGKARFNNLANVQLDGRLLSVMMMETKLTQFTDTEKIYSDPETLLPIRVERDILKLLAREKITEDYDQNNFTVTIIKNKGAKQQKLVIKKNGHIHNAVLLPYYVRRIPALDVGRIIIANLPTRRLEIKLVSIEDIKVPAGTFKAYHFKSTPKQIEIWISTDVRRIPLKIQGTGIFAYSMVMSEYSFEPIEAGKEHFKKITEMRKNVWIEEYQYCNDKGWL